MAKHEYVDYPISLTAVAKYPFLKIMIDDVLNNNLEFDDTNVLST